MSDSQAAGYLRDRVVASGGHLELGMRDLRDHFGRTLLDEPARRQISAAMRSVGLSSDPPLEEAGRHDLLLLSAGSRRPAWVAPSGRQPIGSPAFDPDPGADPALVGVAGTGLAATVVGFVLFGFVGGLTLLAASLVLLFVIAGTEWSARRSLLVAALSLLLVSVLVISPLTADEPRELPDPARDAAVRTSALQASAMRALESGDYDGALRIADVDLRDRNLARRIRHRAAGELLDQAERAIDSSPRRALALARRSAGYRQTERAEEIEQQAQALVEAEETASEPLPAPPEESNPLPEEPAEPDPSYPEDDGGSEDGGSSGFACGPGDIDGDGDGRCNE